MPTKETRESIEAELNASEIDLINAEFLQKLVEIEEMEIELQKLEAARGLPQSQRERPLTERMSALGMDPLAIERVRSYLDAIDTLNRGGGIDTLRADIRQKLSVAADAKVTGAELLAAILEKRRKII